jgi:hypothetical protein
VLDALFLDEDGDGDGDDSDAIAKEAPYGLIAICFQLRQRLFNSTTKQQNDNP